MFYILFMSAFGRYFFAPLSLPALRAVLLFFSVLWVCRVSLRVLDCQRFIGCRVGRGLRVLGRGGSLVLLLFDLLYFIFCLCLPSADIFCPPFFARFASCFYWFLAGCEFAVCRCVCLVGSVLSVVGGFGFLGF